MYVNHFHVCEHRTMQTHSNHRRPQPNGKQIKWKCAPTRVPDRSGSGAHYRQRKRRIIYLCIKLSGWSEVSLLIAHRQRKWIRETYVIIIHSHDFISTESRRRGPLWRLPYERKPFLCCAICSLATWFHSPNGFEWQMRNRRSAVRTKNTFTAKSIQF